jgi:hypothetical protein
VGRIDASDAQRLYVSIAEHEHYAVERSDIVDIHHPGKIGMIASGAVGGVGVGFLLLSPFLSDACPGTDCFLSRRDLAFFAGVVTLIASLPVMLANRSVHVRSRWAAEPPQRPASPPSR